MAEGQQLAHSATVRSASRQMSRGRREGATVKRYKAMIWIRDSDKRGKRVSIEAENLRKAKEELEAQYGEGNVFNLYNEEDAARPR
jgi:hypothetical protein